MNLRKTCPAIPDDWKGGITDVCRILGDEKPLNWRTVQKYIRLGSGCGGIDARPGANGRLQISGKEAKRLWSIL